LTADTPPWAIAPRTNSSATAYAMGRGAYNEQASGMSMKGQLDVLSKPLEAKQASQTQAKLKAENAQ
jgi:hypothetical protein